MKLIVIGASLSGKTTLVRHLRSTSNQQISEMDEELTKINGGQYPLDIDLKHRTLVPKVIDKVLSSDDIIFFTNTDYFDLSDLRKAKQKGFKIVQLEISFIDLQKRNEARAQSEGYDDLKDWLPDMVDYQKDLQGTKLVDTVINATLPTEAIAKKILALS